MVWILRILTAAMLALLARRLLQIFDPFLHTVYSSLYFLVRICIKFFSANK